MRFRIVAALVGLLLFAMAGVAQAGDPDGRIVFKHDILCGPAVTVAVALKSDPQNYQTANVEPGGDYAFAVAPGTYLVGFAAAADPSTPVGATEVTVGAGETKRVKASEILLGDPIVCPSETKKPSETASPSETEKPSESESPSETASPSPSASVSPTAVRTPSRIDTGAGGSSGDGGGVVFAGIGVVAALTVAGAAGLMRRRSAA